MEYLKADKSKGLQKQFLSYLQFCAFFLYFKFGLKNFCYQQALGRAQICLTFQQILGNSTEGNGINLTQKIPVFFVAKHYVKFFTLPRSVSEHA